MTGPAKMTIDRSAPAGLISNDSALAAVRDQAGGADVYLVGGSVRDALLGETPFDLDVVVDGPVAELAKALDPAAVVHPRFETAEISIDGRTIDLARARSEKYPRPGALPEVEPAPITSDLARRDFTINAIAVALDGPGDLIDPCDGAQDLERRVIRVIHPDSFNDDPTRALRAARYAARLGFDVDHRTADLLPAVDLTSVSADRVRSELELIAEEASAVEAVRLASAWGLITMPEERLLLLASAFEQLARPEWQGFCDRSDVLDALVDGTGEAGWRDLIEYPGPPSRATALAARRDPVEILLARADGAEWLDRWVRDWRRLSLEVTGADLIAAGVPKGEAVGRGLNAALEAALDRGVEDHDGQLAVALEAARSAQDGDR